MTEADPVTADKDIGPSFTARGETLVDVIGGRFWAALLIVLILGAVIFDFLLLGALIDLVRAVPSGQPPGGQWAFRSVFSTDPVYWGGGFAPLLLLILGVMVSGLRLLAPRSLWPSLIMFAAMLVLQFLISSSGAIVGYMDDLFGWVFDFTPDRQNMLFLRYDAFYWVEEAGDWVPTQSIGIAREDSNSVALNLALAAFYAGLVLVLGCGAAAVRRVRGKALPTPTERVLGWPLPIGGAHRTIHILAAGFIVVAFLSGPSLLVMFSSNPDPLLEPLSGVLWIAPVLFFVDLARLSLWTVSDGALAPENPDAPDKEESPLILAGVHKQLAAQFGSDVVSALSVTGLGSAAPKDSRASGKTLRPLLGSRRRQLILRTLTPEDLRLAVELINARALDHGQMALVIVPQDALDEVQGDLSRIFENQPYDLAVSIYRVQDVPRDQTGRINATVDVLLASPETLSILADDSVAFDGELGRLGAMVLLNMQLMDVGALHVTLRRLEAKLSGLAPISVLAQSEQLGGALTWMKNLPVVGRHSFETLHEKSADDLLDRYVLLVREGFTVPEFGQATWTGEQRALVWTLRADVRAEPFMFSFSGRGAGDANKPVINWLTNEDENELVSRVEAAPKTGLAPIEAVHPVAIVRDRANLATALAQGVATPTTREGLKVIVTGAYPLALFLSEVFNKGVTACNGSSSDLRHFLDDFVARFGPLAADPLDGPRETAMSIAREFASLPQTGDLREIGEDRIAGIWPTEMRTLRQLGITQSSAAGLNRLFELAFGLPEGTKTVRGKLREDRDYNFEVHYDRIAGEMSARVLRYMTGSSVTVALPMADEGLSYAVGSHIRVDGDAYVISEIRHEDRRFALRATHAFVSEVFSRSYDALRPSSNRLDATVQSYVQNFGAESPHDVIFGFMAIARTTSSGLQFATEHKPFSKDQKPVAMPFFAPVVSPRMLRSLCVLRLFPQTGPEPLAQQPRRGAGEVGGWLSDGVGIAAGSGRSAPQVAGATDMSRLALTLACTLQDVLASFFPANAHRISVLSPEAGMMVPQPTVADGMQQVNAFIAKRQPWLGDPSTQGAASGRIALGAQTREQYRQGLRKMAEQGGLTSDRGAASDPLVTLMVVEDSDHNLGVARVVYDQLHNSGNVLRKAWAEFLTYCEETEGDPDRHPYSFGSQEVPDCFDFAEARRIVSGMIT